jgi:threonyl-tRNA synthetase
MSLIKIKLPDNSLKEFDSSVTPLQVAQSISRSLAQKALAALVDGKVVDLERPISKDSEVRILTWDDQQGRDVFWHSSAHLMASAVVELFPDTKLAIGPAIPDDFSARFYYDLDMPRKLTESDLEKIEKKMAEIAARNLPFDLFVVEHLQAQRIAVERDAAEEMRGDQRDVRLGAG